MNSTCEFFRQALLFGILVCCGTACTYTEVPFSRAPVTDWLGLELSANTIESCQAACTANSSCKAADFNKANSLCYLLQVEQTPPYNDDNDFSHLIKTCAPPPASCTMTRTADKKATSATKVQVSMTDAGHCSSACLHLAECRGVRYSGGECKIYAGTTPSESNTGDTLTHVKESCSAEGTPCCMMGVTTLKASDDAVMTLTSSVASCETVCLTSSNCQAVYFRNDVCYVYLSVQETESQVGATYSEKSCTGSSTSDVTITEECYGSTGTIPSQRIFLAVLVAMLTMCFR